MATSPTWRPIQLVPALCLGIPAATFIQRRFKNLCSYACTLLLLLHVMDKENCAFIFCLLGSDALWFSTLVPIFQTNLLLLHTGNKRQSFTLKVEVADLNETRCFVSSKTIIFVLLKVSEI